MMRLPFSVTCLLAVLVVVGGGWEHSTDQTPSESVGHHTHHPSTAVGLGSNESTTMLKQTLPTAEMHEGIAICTDHDPTVWHPLVRRDEAGEVACTYGHEHHADPNAVNDIFGPPSAWYGGAQAISYPWQTSSALGQENHAKHEGYKWFVGRDTPCRPGNTSAGNDGCIVSWRVQVHTRGDVSDATTRFHSFSMEAVVQDQQGRKGIVRHGGHLDFGHLALNVDGGNGQLCQPQSAWSFQPATFQCSVSPERDHSSVNVPAPHRPHNSVLAAWYSDHRITIMSVTLEEWGPIDYQNPTQQVYHTPRPGVTANNSTGHIGNMGIGTLLPGNAGLSPDGLVRLNTYTDRNGFIVQGCVAPGVDCVPLVIEAAPQISSLWRKSLQTPPPPDIDYDVVSPVTGKSLIMFPN